MTPQDGRGGGAGVVGGVEVACEVEALANKSVTARL